MAKKIEYPAGSTTWCIKRDGMPDSLVYFPDDGEGIHKFEIANLSSDTIRKLFGAGDYRISFFKKLKDGKLKPNGTQRLSLRPPVEHEEAPAMAPPPQVVVHAPHREPTEVEKNFMFMERMQSFAIAQTRSMVEVANVMVGARAAGEQQVQIGQFSAALEGISKFMGHLDARMTQMEAQRNEDRIRAEREEEDDEDDEEEDLIEQVLDDEGSISKKGVAKVVVKNLPAAIEFGKGVMGGIQQMMNSQRAADAAAQPVAEKNPTGVSTITHPPQPVA